ncbi:MAG: radical SAM protein [archaeon]
MEYIDNLLKLRNNVARKNKGVLEILLANFSGTEQQKDIEARTPVVNDFFRVKINIKAFDEKEMQKRGLHAVDFHNNVEVFDAMTREFDMPYWAFVKLKNVPLADLQNTFIYQLKACNIHCPWCYVDDKNKNGVQDNNSRFFSIPEIVDVFEEKRKEQKLYNLRPSGGEPTLVVEQWLELLREVKKRGLGKDVYVQGDTNLTTGHFIDSIEEKGEIEKDLLEKVAEHENFGLLCSFKGTDLESFLEAAGMPEQYSFLEEERWYAFEKLLKAGVDAYPFIYNPNPSSVKQFMEKGAGKFGEGFYLKTWILPLKLYGPEKERLARKGVNPADYQKQLDDRFSKSEEIMQGLIWKEYGLNYKAVPRTGIKLEVRR